MDQDSLENAILRLDAAVTRAEAAFAARPACAPAAPAPAADADLAERHAALRAGTAEALARLDRLIETGSV
jgi:hypothetical protein